MAIPGRSTKSDEAVRREASDWAALVHDPDAQIDREAFERWRAADSRHAAVYERMERGWEQSALIAQTSSGRERRLPERRRRLLGLETRYAIAAVAVLVATMVGLAFGVPQILQRLVGVDATELASQVGQIRKVVLDDGSTVTLDTDSTLRIAYTSGERRLYLTRGRARFDVAHDAGRPFIVMAGGGSIVARGTLFDVGITDGRIRVTLLRGVVDVRNDGTTSNPAEAPATKRLLPNQKMVFVASAPLPSPQPVVDADTQWAAGMLLFDRTRLADAIASANRYSTVKINIADPGLNDLRITGAYHATDTVGLARSVAVSLDLRLTRTRQGDLLLSPPDAISGT